MEVLKTFRHEYKYVISYDEMLKIRSKLDKLLSVDRSETGYMIRSLYFDSLNDNDYYDKLGGEYQRKKIRLRIYDLKSNKLKLEIKQKIDYHQLKESLVIDKKDALKIMKENYKPLLKYKDELAKRLYVILKEGNYKPKVVIEYHRIAYTTGTTTRITFDFDIKKSDNYKMFFSKDINYINLSDIPEVVLEVKFDRFLEPYIGDILSKYNKRYQSVSKYVIGRNI